jgi:acyl-CoA synthetase (AMP-forming)/AMP-acid ligase II
MSNKLETFPYENPTVGAFIRRRAAEIGDQQLIVLGSRSLTYAQAEERSTALAHGLLDAGIGKGSHVGVLMPNGPDWVTVWLAAARIGAVLVPINTFYKPRELAWVLHHADVSTLLTVDRYLGHDYLERLEESAPSLAECNGRDVSANELPCLKSVYVWGEATRSWSRSADPLFATATSAAVLEAAEAEVSPDDPMMIIYSSGSTADPKGAVHGQGSTLRHAWNLNTFRDLTQHDRIYTPMPFFWVGGFVFSLLAAMHAGACLLTEESFEPGRTLDLLENEAATIVAGWPHYSKAMSEHESFPRRDLSRLRGGNLYDLLPEDVRPNDPELRANSLGMTETCGPHTIGRMDVDLPESLRGSFGKSVPGLEHKIVDPESGETLAAGEFGEICVRGYSLMQGLYKVVRDEVFDGDGYYHTGDGGYFDADGHLYFKGRLGDVIKTGGANVSPLEIEQLMAAMDEIKQAYVIGLPDADRGEIVAAAVVLNADAELSQEDLAGRLKKELSSYKVPKRYFFRTSEELPFTDTGKIDKRKLVAALADA